MKEDVEKFLGTKAKLFDIYITDHRIILIDKKSGDTILQCTKNLLGCVKTFDELESCHNQQLELHSKVNPRYRISKPGIKKMMVGLFAITKIHFKELVILFDESTFVGSRKRICGNVRQWLLGEDSVSYYHAYMEDEEYYIDITSFETLRSEYIHFK